MKEETLKDIKKGFKIFTSKVGRALSDIKADAGYGKEIGKLKLQELNLQKENLKTFYDLGKKTYDLYNNKKIELNQAELLRYFKKIKTNESKIKQFHSEIKKISKKLKPIHL